MLGSWVEFLISWVASAESYPAYFQKVTGELLRINNGDKLSQLFGDFHHLSFFQ